MSSKGMHSKFLEVYNRLTKQAINGFKQYKKEELFLRCLQSKLGSNSSCAQSAKSKLKQIQTKTAQIQKQIAFSNGDAEQCLTKLSKIDNSCKSQCLQIYERKVSTHLRKFMNIVQSQ